MTAGGMNHVYWRILGQSLRASLAGQLLLVVTGVITARLLGPEGRGLLAIVILAPSVLGAIATAGTPQAIVFYVAGNPHFTRALLRTVWPLLLRNGVVAVALYLIAITWLSPPETLDHRWIIVAAVAAIPCGMVFQASMAFLQGLGHFHAFQVLKLVPVITNALLLLACVVAGQNALVVVAACWICAMVASAACGAMAVNGAIRELPAQAMPADGPRATQLLRFGLKGLLGKVSPLEILRLDQAVVAIWFSPTALGLYVVGQAFANFPRILSYGIAEIAFSQVRRSSQSPEGSLSHARQIAFFNVALVGCVVAALHVLVPWLVPIFFGESFSSAVPVAQLLVMAGGFAAVRVVFVDILRGLDRPAVSSIAESAAIAVFLVLFSLALPEGDITAVGGALLASQAVALLVVLAMGGQSLRDPQEGAASSATASRYMVYSWFERPLFAVPQQSRALRLAALARLQSSTWKRSLYRLVLHSCIRLGLDGLLGQERPVVRVLGNRPGLDLKSIAEGLRPYIPEKAGVVIFWPKNQDRGRLYLHLFDGVKPIGFAKLATERSAAQCLEREANALRALAGLAGGTFRVPAVIGEGWIDSYTFLLMQSFPSSARSMRGGQFSYPDACVAAFSGNHSTIAPHEVATLSWWSRYEQGLSREQDPFHRDLVSSLTRGIDVCMAHGDLSPHNVVRDGRTLWICDWESSAIDAPVLADRVGFELAAHPVLAAKNHRRLLAGLERSLEPEHGSEARVGIMLALAYRHAFGFVDADRILRNWGRSA